MLRGCLYRLNWRRRNKLKQREREEALAKRLEAFLRFSRPEFFESRSLPHSPKRDGGESVVDA